MFVVVGFEFISDSFLTRFYKGVSITRCLLRLLAGGDGDQTSFSLRYVTKLRYKKNRATPGLVGRKLLLFCLLLAIDKSGKVRVFFRPVPVLGPLAA